MESAEDAQQQRRAVTDGEQRHVQRDVAQSIQEENDAGEEQQMVVACDHVLGAEIDVRADMRAGVVDQERLVVTGDTVSERGRRNDRGE